MNPNTVILHSPADETIPFADSQELPCNSGLPDSALIEVGTEHRLADEESLKAMLEAVERATAAVEGTRMTGSAVPKTTVTDRITRWLLIAIGVYSVLLVGFLNLVILNSDNVKGPGHLPHGRWHDPAVDHRRWVAHADAAQAAGAPSSQPSPSIGESASCFSARRWP